VLVECESDRRQSARVSQGVIPQAKIKTVKMTIVIVLGTANVQVVTTRKCDVIMHSVASVCVYVSVCQSVLFTFRLSKALTYNFIFALQVHLQNI